MAGIGVGKSFHKWRDELCLYWRESRRVRDFVSLLRVRLSQSRLGARVAPHSFVVDVDLHRLGHGVRLRSHTTDILVLHEIILGDSVGRLPAGFKPRTIVDLGANIGLTYRWWNSLYPDARVVCVEPDPGNLASLRANVRSARGNCEIISACVGGHARRATLVGTYGDEWGFRLADASEAKGDVTDVVTMEQILGRSSIDGIDLLKCDIEGAEAEVFDNCVSWIHRVDHAVIETHAEAMTTEELLAALCRNGGHFKVVHVATDRALGRDMVTLRRVAAAID
jgi:FkbM family methyltransferase